MEFLSALSQFDFLQNALLAGLLAAFACGLMGPFVVVKRIGFLAGGIAHSVLGGMGVALYLGLNPVAGALVAAIAAALIIGWVKLNWQGQEDTLIGALWAIGMAIGILFISRTPGYQGDLMSYLFGNILLVPVEQLWWMAGLDALLATIVLVFYRPLLAICFDEEFARLRGVPVTFFYLLLLCLVAISIVLLLQVVGLVLVIALLTLPAAIAGHYVHTLGRMMLLAIALGMLLTSGGLALSYQPDLPAGASIVLLTGTTFLFSTIWARLLQRRRAVRRAQGLN